MKTSCTRNSRPPFCGCGTTVHAAEKLGRQWIGIDVTHLAIGLIEKRLKDAFPGVEYKLHGVPADIAGARQMFADDDPTKKEFEKWAVSLIGAQPWRAGKKGADGGIDGIIKEDRLGLDTIYIQAKRWQGSVGRPEIQKFVGALSGQRAKKGVFITTSRFTADAIEYASLIETKVVLMDGEKLASLMMDFDVGVSTQATYVIKKVDSDYFDEA